jgi:hypothetical protein
MSKKVRFWQKYFFMKHIHVVKKKAAREDGNKDYLTFVNFLAPGSGFTFPIRIRIKKSQCGSRS